MSHLSFFRKSGLIKMVIIELQGGLGNQMFQYATASILAKRNYTEVGLETGFFEKSRIMERLTERNFELGVFENLYTFVSVKELQHFYRFDRRKKLCKILRLPYPKVFSEKEFRYYPDLFEFQAPILLRGYFQSFRYFEDEKEFVKNLFKVLEIKLGQPNLDLIEEIQNEQSVAVHVRRGDYVSSQIVQNIHGICGLDYYKEAIFKLIKNYKKLHFFFFSDDMDWVKEEFSFLNSRSFVDNNIGSNSWKDMILMSKCNHNIIANSSFSWWGAWLNNNKDKTVIAPKKWFAEDDLNLQTSDLIPPSWIRI